jgi:hypothetical protein
MEQIYNIKNNCFLEIGEWQKYENLYFSDDLKLFSDAKFPNKDSSIFNENSNIKNSINKLDYEIFQLRMKNNRKG